MTVAHLADGSSPPRVAFAVGRRVGPAVVRNRVRRRLRSVLAEEVATRGGLAPGPGAYLVSVRPAAADASFDELGAAVRGALARLAGS